MMARASLLVSIACILGCSAESSPSTAGNSQQTISHGRVTLVAHEIETGSPKGSSVQSGLDNATSVLNDLLQTDEFRTATGTLAGRFRLDSDGTVQMFLTDGATSIANADESELENAFVGAAFSGKCSFPELGDIAMVYAQFKIDPPK